MRIRKSIQSGVCVYWRSDKKLDGKPVADDFFCRGVVYQYQGLFAVWIAEVNGWWDFYAVTTGKIQPTATFKTSEEADQYVRVTLKLLGD